MILIRCYYLVSKTLVIISQSFIHSFSSNLLLTETVLYQSLETDLSRSCLFFVSSQNSLVKLFSVVEAKNHLFLKTIKHLDQLSEDMTISN